MPRQPRMTSRRKGRKQKAAELIPFVEGFLPPSKTEILEAIGFGSVSLPKAFDASDSSEGFQFFKPIPSPTSIDDWLAQYKVRGQTYQQYVEHCSWLANKKHKLNEDEPLLSNLTIKQRYPGRKIYIVQVGQFDNSDSDIFDRLIEYTETFLALPVETLPSLKLEICDGNVSWVVESERRIGSSEGVKKYPLTSRYDPGSKHVQMCVSANLMQLRETIPDDALCLIGLTMMDLYGDLTDLFVAGMAGSQRVAIFSLYRYDPRLAFSTEFWYDVKRTKSPSAKRCQKLILQRGCKLLVHEICHLLGVGHCIFFDCCMNGSGHLEEDFRQPMHLCPVDLHKLHTLVGFDIETRYRALLEFYKREGFTEERDWVTQRLKRLNE